jgi:hypothetical protein
MRVYMWTKHTISRAGMRADVDGDRAVQLTLPSTVLKASEGKVITNWYGREDLLALRAIINKALTLIP